MALVVKSAYSDEKGRRSFRADRKPWMLKDYLGDDLSSCSSNGFRSFPRKQCCAAAVRNIMEKDTIRKGKRSSNYNNKKKLPKRSKGFSTTLLERASMAVINAVKLLPFNYPAKVSSSSREGFLSRSFSRKLFRRSFFWKSKDKSPNTVTTTTTTSQYDRTRKKRTSNDELHEGEDDEIERWISSGVVGKEKYEPLDLSNDTTVTKFSTTSVSNSDGKSEDNSSSWGDDITFTSDGSTENDVVQGEENLEDLAVSERVAEDSVKPVVINLVSLWYNEENGKEHSSPVSVLDFPYNEEGNSSPFTRRTLCLKGTQERLLKKLGRFEYLAKLEPVNLESLISSTELEDPLSPKYSIQPCATPSYILSCVSEEDEEEEGEEGESIESEVEKRAQHLLNITKSNIPTKINFELENVMLDFFREKGTQTNDVLLKMAKNWLNGHYDTLILGWEVKDKRQAYIRDMEEGGWWPRDNILEREEVLSKLGDEVLVHLIEELIVDFCTC